MKIAYFAATCVATLCATSSATASIIFTGATLTQNFTGYDGSSGPAGWDADGFSSGAGFTENRGISTGGSSTGGTYAFNIGGGNIALGVQAGGSDFTPGYYQLEVINNTGFAISSWDVSFNSYVFNDQTRSNSFNFSFSTNGTDFTEVAAGSFSSTEAADNTPTWTLGAAFDSTLTASVANGGSLYLRWTGDDVSGSGSRDEFALDDVSISAIPEPSTSSLLGFITVSLLVRRKRS